MAWEVWWVASNPEGGTRTFLTSTMLRKLELKTLLDLKASRQWQVQHILEPWPLALLFSLSFMRKPEKLEGRKYVPTHSRSQRPRFLGQHQESDLWTGSTAPEIHDSRTSYHSAHAQDQVWQIWLAENAKRLLFAWSENWTLSEASGSENAYLPNYHIWIEFNPWVLSYHKKMPFLTVKSVFGLPWH